MAGLLRIRTENHAIGPFPHGTAIVFIPYRFSIYWITGMALMLTKMQRDVALWDAICLECCILHSEYLPKISKAISLK